MMSDTNSIQKTTASTLAELTPTMAYGVMIRLRDWHLSSSGWHLLRSVVHQADGTTYVYTSGGSVTLTSDEPCWTRPVG